MLIIMLLDAIPQFSSPPDFFPVIFVGALSRKRIGESCPPSPHWFVAVYLKTRRARHGPTRRIPDDQQDEAKPKGYC